MTWPLTQMAPGQCCPRLRAPEIPEQCPLSSEGLAGEGSWGPKGHPLHSVAPTQPPLRVSWALPPPSRVLRGSLPPRATPGVASRPAPLPPSPSPQPRAPRRSQFRCPPLPRELQWGPDEPPRGWGGGPSPPLPSRVCISPPWSSGRGARAWPRAASRLGVRQPQRHSLPEAFPVSTEELKPFLE